MPTKTKNESNEELREHTLTILEESLPKLSKDQIRTLEESLESKTETTDEYARLVIKIIQNLKSEYVMKNIRSGTFSIEEFLNLERETLNPTKWQALQEARMPKTVKKERVKGTNQCPRCKSWYTTYKQAQTRSGDEGLTTRCYCEDCEYHWKFG